MRVAWGRTWKLERLWAADPVGLGSKGSRCVPLDTYGHKAKDRQGRGSSLRRSRPAHRHHRLSPHRPIHARWQTAQQHRLGDSTWAFLGLDIPPSHRILVSHSPCVLGETDWLIIKKAESRADESSRDHRRHPGGAGTTAPVSFGPPEHRFTGINARPVLPRSPVIVPRVRNRTSR